MLRHNLGNGHTCLPADKLIPTAAAMLGVEEEPVRQTAEEMAETFDLKAADIAAGGSCFCRICIRRKNLLPRASA